MITNEVSVRTFNYFFSLLFYSYCEVLRFIFFFVQGSLKAIMYIRLITLPCVNK